MAKRKVDQPRPWYIENPNNADELSLCNICRHIDFNFLFQHALRANFARIELGLLRDIIKKDSCAFCRLVAHVISVTYKTNLIEALKNEAKDTICELMNEAKQTHDSNRVYVLEVRIFSDGGAIDSEFDLSARIHCLADERNPKPTEGRLVSKYQAEMSLLKRWLHTCENEHPSGDSNPGNMAKADSFLRVIDVQRQCIVKAPRMCRYMALSYVWGGPQELQLTKKTQPELEGPNGLPMDDTRLPRTITDAMLLVSRLDERYLWVDSLCIMQDDAENKHDQIALMDVIYQKSILTLVAVSGKNAGAGLPGVAAGSRNVLQQIEHIQGLDLVNSLITPSYSVDQSMWNARAWTYQEWKLSRRVLLLADEQISFKCDHVSCWEDEIEPNFRSSETNPGFEARSWALDRDYSPDRLPLKGQISFRMYGQAVKAYTPRSLSFDSDALNAFSGMMNYLRPIMRGGYAYGLPETELDQALLWQPDGLITRRKHPDSGSAMFPSWTWAGWVGSVDYFEVDVFSEITWWAPDNEGFSSEEYRYPQECRYQNDGKWEHRHAEFRHYYIHSDEPDTFHLHPTALETERSPRLRIDTSSGKLRFWALSAFFSMTGDHNIFTHVGKPGSCADGSHIVCQLSIFDREGILAGTVCVPGPIASDLAKTRHEFILLSRTRLENKYLYEQDPLKLEKQSLANWSLDHTPPEIKQDDTASDSSQPEFAFDRTRYDAEKLFCVYNVMLIEWKEGVAYRLGLGWIHIDAFHQAFPEKKLIVLG